MAAPGTWLDYPGKSALKQSFATMNIIQPSSPSRPPLPLWLLQARLAILFMIPCLLPIRHRLPNQGRGWYQRPPVIARRERRFLER